MSFRGWLRLLTLVLTYNDAIGADMDMGDIQITANEEARTTTITLPVTRVQVILFLRRILELWRQKTGFLNKITFDDYNSFINEQKIVA